MLGLLNRLFGKTPEKPPLVIEGPLPREKESGRRFYSCQHSGPAGYTLIVDGVVYEVRKGRVCPDCCKKELLETYTCCSRCGRIIIRNDEITLQKDSPDLHYKSIAFRFADLYVACTRPGCYNGTRVVGVWKGPQEINEASVVMKR